MLYLNQIIKLKLTFKSFDFCTLTSTITHLADNLHNKYDRS